MNVRAGLAMSVILGASLAGADQQVEQLMARAHSINPGLRDYTAEVSVAMKATIGPLSYQPKGQATYYYKRDGWHKLEVTSGPRQLKDYPFIFGFNLPKMEEFTSSVVEETTYAGRPVFHCQFLPTSASNVVAKIDLLLDKGNYTVPHYLTEYRNQGHLSVDVDYTTVDKYLVFNTMRAQADFPSTGTTATGEAHYSRYSFNKNLPDKLFLGFVDLLFEIPPA